jgi:hypothetical protein
MAKPLETEEISRTGKRQTTCLRNSMRRERAIKE